jgi:hypothetical protein
LLKKDFSPAGIACLRILGCGFIHRPETGKKQNARGHRASE